MTNSIRKRKSIFPRSQIPSEICETVVPPPRWTSCAVFPSQSMFFRTKLDLILKWEMCASSPFFRGKLDPEKVLSKTVSQKVAD